MDPMGGGRVVIFGSAGKKNPRASPSTPWTQRVLISIHGILG